jgi:methylenetetrahydrofolate reductase (NADPH)
VRFIRETQGADWHIEVAAYPEYHPQQRYARRDLQHFADKVKAGADSAITQFFFNPDAYFHFVDEVRALGVTCPSCRASCPSTTSPHRAVRGARRHRDPALGGAEDGRLPGRHPPAIRAFGIDVVTSLCQRLIAGGAPGIHFYTLNQSRCRWKSAAGWALI